MHVNSNPQGTRESSAPAGISREQTGPVGQQVEWQLGMEGVALVAAALELEASLAGGDLVRSWNENRDFLDWCNCKHHAGGGQAQGGPHSPSPGPGPASPAGLCPGPRDRATQRLQKEQQTVPGLSLHATCSMLWEWPFW